MPETTFQAITQLVNLGGFLGMLAYLAYNLFLREKREEVPIWAQELMQHFNHETTDQNQEMIGILREVRDGVIKTNSKLETWERYGAPQIK